MIFICPECKKEFDDTDYEVFECDCIRKEGICSKCLEKE